MRQKKVILHLCADIGSDSYFYDQHDDYKVIKIGEDIGVENYTHDGDVYGIIANPVCTEFSTACGFHKERDYEQGMFLVNHCLRIIKETNPHFHVIENPAMGKLRKFLGKPDYTYQPWWYGDPWTKMTALWGNFNIPERTHEKWGDVTKNDKLYVRPNRPKPSLAFLHKSAIDNIDNLRKFKHYINNDADFRSLCSQGFAEQFFKANR